MIFPSSPVGCSPVGGAFYELHARTHDVSDRTGLVWVSRVYGLRRMWLLRFDRRSCWCLRGRYRRVRDEERHVRCGPTSVPQPSFCRRVLGSRESEPREYYRSVPRIRSRPLVDHPRSTIRCLRAKADSEKCAVETHERADASQHDRLRPVGRRRNRVPLNRSAARFVDAMNEVTIGPCRLIHGDCRDVLPTLPKVDAIVTDPPYGISYDGTHGKYRNGIDRGNCEWDVGAFDPHHLISLDVPSIIWGGELLCCFASVFSDVACVGENRKARCRHSAIRLRTCLDELLRKKPRVYPSLDRSLQGLGT